MKTNKYFTSEKRAEFLRMKNEKEKEKQKDDDNEENEEEEEEEEEEDEKNKMPQKPKSFQVPRQAQTINKDIKATILKREEKSKLLTQTQMPASFNKQRIIYHQNPENDNSKEGSSIRRVLQEKKTQNTNTTMTAASRILAKKDILRTGQNQPYNIRISQNSPRTQLKSQNPQGLAPPLLKTQNSQAQMQVKSKIAVKNEIQPQVPPYHSKYSRRIVDSSVHNEDNAKEIKIINRNNNYTINVTNNNNTINVTNNSNNTNDTKLNKNIDNEKYDENNNNKDKEEDEKEEINIERKEIRKEIRKEPRREIREIRKEPRREEKEINNNIEEKENKIEKKEKEDTSNIIEKDNKNDNNEKDSNIKKEIKEINLFTNKKESDLPDRRKEYATNDIMVKNGVEIVKFSPEETQKVFDKKAEAHEIKKKNPEKKKKYNNYRNKDYDRNSNNFYRPRYKIFYQRGRDNFAKRIYNDRDNFYDNDDSFDYDNYENYNNKTFNAINNFNRFEINSHKRINNFYERGRPNQISRGFRGRRGGRY